MSKHDIESLCQKLKNARQTTVSDHPEPIRTTRNISSEDEESVPPMKSFTVCKNIYTIVAAVIKINIKINI